MQEANGFGSLQYLNSNAPIYGSKLNVAPVPGLDDASLFHQGAPSVAASARVGATPYWSLDDSAMTNTGMSDVFQKRQAPSPAAALRFPGPPKCPSTHPRCLSHFATLPAPPRLRPRHHPHTPSPRPPLTTPCPHCDLHPYN